MLNILYGWCGLGLDKEELSQFAASTIDDAGAFSTDKNDYQAGGLYSYTKYKPSINYTNEKYLVSIIGNLSFQKKNIEDNIEKLLEQYQNNDLSFLQELKGQFLFAIINKEDNSAFIVNDSMASFPLFYTLSDKGQLAFANKLKPLMKLKQFISPSNDCYKINQQAIYNYIYFHMIPSPGTIFQDAYKLEPGQYLLYKEGNYKVDNYSSPAFTEDNKQSEDELAQAIFDTLDNSVKQNISNPERTGCFLSGGLDSSAVAGMLAKNSSQAANTFSIGFPVAEYNEIDYARSASKTFKTHQHEYFIQPEDIHSVIHDIISFMDEPFGNSSVVPAYYCAKLAKESGVDHLLAGDGGDEIFAGNTRYSKQQVFERYFSLPEVLRKKLLEPVINSALFSSNPIGKKAKSYITQANVPLPARLETYNFLHMNSPESVFTSSFLTQISQDEPVDLLNNTYNRPENSTYLNRMLFLDWKHTLADNDLRKVNMMCELAGVDVSYPMLSNDMVDLSCKIPSKLKLTPYKLRYLYKKAMKDFLPDSIINKPKQGFGLPFGVWTKTDKDLQSIAYSTIEKLKAYNIFNEEFLADTIEKHKNVHASYYGELIWLLMILGIWLEEFSAIEDSK